VGTEKLDYVSVSALSGSEVAESENRYGRLCLFVCLVCESVNREWEQIRWTMYLSVPDLGVR
jgi:hypothetical protein